MNLRRARRWMAPPARGRRALAAAAAVAAAMSVTLVASNSPAAGQPAPVDPAASVERSASPRTDLAPGTYQVTLLTGDQARLVVSGDRHVSVDLVAAPRPDGSTPELEWYTAGDGVYVIPEDARPHLDAGLLDWRLFDVERLAAHGLTDADADALPLIVEYADGASPATALRSAGAGPRGKVVRPLPSLDAAAVEVDRADAAGFWAAVRGGWAAAGGARSRAAAPAIEKVWLDDVAKVTLDESVPQIGAPEAWAAGLDGSGVTVAVLDTGFDPGHPDLAGAVVGSRGFIEGLGTKDGHGHGTHVATTIAGNGAASGGRYTGVAPGADLVIGKVCDNAGNCPNSAVIAGMEWAAIERDADVVNLSLGACCTDGTDPMSQAVNRLSAETGALFVIAAGNDGRNASISSPGAADAALTVAALTKSGEHAGFSNRGPRAGDDAFKPEIAAPGVDIVAGRAAGTSMGSPVDDYYTSANGTSMATPHVAGAAAILAQRHPDWDWARLKAGLMSSAHDLGHNAYAQGAGRVDVARAIRQQVEVSPPVADFRFLRPDDPAATRTLTYRNPTAAPVTLALTSTLARTTGGAAPAGALTMDADTLTVPAGGTASVNVHLDHSPLAVARYTGSVVATAGDLRLTTPVGVVVGDQTIRVTLKLTARSCDNGVHCFAQFSSFSFGSLAFYRYDDLAETPAGTRSADGLPPAAVAIPAPERVSVQEDGQTVTVDVFVERARYAVQWDPQWIEAGTNRWQRAELWLPQVEVDGALTLEMDANRAVKVRHLPPQPVGEDGYASSRGFHRVNEDGVSRAGGGVSSFGGGNYWSYPSAPVTDGRFVLSYTDVLEAPQVTIAVAGAEPVRLHPMYSGYRHEATGHWTVPVRFPEGTRTLPVVDLGIGGEADYDGVDVSGKLVMVGLERGPGFCRMRVGQLERALAAGAAGVLYNVETCSIQDANIETIPGMVDKPQIPYVALPAADAQLLKDRLREGPVEVTVTSVPESPYTYYVKAYARDGVPESLDYHYRHDQMMRVDANYHYQRDGWMHYSRYTRYPEEWFLVTQPHDIVVPSSRVQYIAPVGSDLTQERRLSHPARFGHPDPAVSRQDVFDRPGRTVEHWNAEPWVPGFLDAGQVAYPICAGCREGDTLQPYVRVATGDPAYQLGANPVGWGTPPGASTDPDPWAGLRVYRDGELVTPEHVLNLANFPYYPMSPEEADYRVVLDLTRFSDDSHTEWRFRSGTTAEGEQVPEPYMCQAGKLQGWPDLTCRAEPFIFLRYAGLDTDLRNRVAAPGAHRFQVGAYRQPSATPPPDVVGLKLWTSYDGGETWREAKVERRSDGWFSVKVVHPPARHRASDSVTIRAEAWDAAGNRVIQTVPDAYRLTGAHRDFCGTGGCFTP